PLQRGLKGPPLHHPAEEVRRWTTLRDILLDDPAWRWNFGVHSLLFRLAYSDRRPQDGPAPAWVPDADDVRRSNLASLAEEVGVRSYPELHRWSVEHRDPFWATMIRRVG